MPRHITQQNYTALIDALGRQLEALANVLAAHAPQIPIPLEVAIELQHMLLHMLLASECTLADYEVRTTQLKHSLGHLDRAMLDACKIQIEKEFSVLSQKLTFTKEWIELRQRESRDHFRGESTTNNTTCDKFYILLKKYSLITDHEVPGTINTDHRFHGDTWHKYFLELHRWFKRELLYSSLFGQKSLDALNGMLQSFWLLNTAKLCMLNKRLELDILITNAERALGFGWDGRDILKNHIDFISKYKDGKCNDEEINCNYNSWIRRTFTSLIHFYGQNWSE